MVISVMWGMYIVCTYRVHVEAYTVTAAERGSAEARKRGVLSNAESRKRTKVIVVAVVTAAVCRVLLAAAAGCCCCWLLLLAAAVGCWCWWCVALGAVVYYRTLLIDVVSKCS